MNVLWICNMPIPAIASDLGRTPLNVGGWLVGLLSVLKEQSNLKISICFPDDEVKEITAGNVDNIDWYAIPFRKPLGFRPITYVMRPDKRLYKNMRTIVDRVNPDMLHVFGTELVHSSVAVDVFGKPEKTLVHLQGVLTYILMHAHAGIPEYVKRRMGIAELFKGTINQQYRIMQERSKYERKLLTETCHIAGRTDWDHAASTALSPGAYYHRYSEILRDEFYGRSWNIESCEREAIFFSAGMVPLKGLHYMVQALTEIVKKFPNAKLYIAGNRPVTKKIGRLKVPPLKPSYLRYVEFLVRKYKLEEKVQFTGTLNEKAMCERYIRSHVFVCASTIENSSNSVGEAMLLGVPTVASDVGGIKNLLIHEKEGFIYPSDEPYMLAYYVTKIFSDDDLAKRLSSNSRAHAHVTYNKKETAEKIVQLYSLISGEHI